MYYKKTKRSKIDRCNICLKTKELSWDHVPPKGCSNFESVEITSFFEKYTGYASDKTIIVSHNGLKYRTICKECNSFLGSTYDSDLNSLVKDIIGFVNSALIIPPVIKLKIRPLPIIKSITGHMLAAKKQLGEVKSDNLYREFVLDVNAPIPNNFNLFYWVYPFENTIIMRDFAMLAKRDGSIRNAAFFQLIKFFPIAFLFSDIENYENLQSLTKLAIGSNINTGIDLPIQFNKIVDRFWPERVGNNNIILVSEETENAVFVTKKTMKP